MIPTDLYDSYTTALTENDRQARAALAAIMAQLDPSDIDGIRDALMEAYPALVKLYGTRAAQVALEFYAGVREAQGVTAWFYPELPAESEIYDKKEAVSDVRREVGGLYDGSQTLEAFASTLQGLATKRTMGMADRTLTALASADPANPKVALVPHPGACGWCVLIGSRGFTNTEDAMLHMRHDGCKCTPVVDFDRDNPALEGYDEMEHYGVFSKADSAENQRKWLEEWESMSEDERAKYTRRTKTKDGRVSERPDWSIYRRNRTVQEMNRILRGKTASAGEP